MRVVREETSSVSMYLSRRDKRALGWEVRGDGDAVDGQKIEDKQDPFFSIFFL